VSLKISGWTQIHLSPPGVVKEVGAQFLDRTNGLCPVAVGAKHGFRKTAERRRQFPVIAGAGGARCDNQAMSYTSADARQQVLDELAKAAEYLGVAVARLGEAYESMDEQSADRLEEQLFRPLQAAYGTARRSHAEFAARYDIPGRTFAQASPGRPVGPREELEVASEQVRSADETLVTLQDSMLPVEVGDPELRAGLSRVRELIAPLPERTRELLRVLGR
jgi:hypothetical protein